MDEIALRSSRETVCRLPFTSHHRGEIRLVANLPQQRPAEAVAARSTVTPAGIVDLPQSLTTILFTNFRITIKMTKRLSRVLRLAARYADNLKAVKVYRAGGTAETFWKLDNPWFHRLGIRSVIDVGCNEGQFAIALRHILPNAMIYSFEPIPLCAERTRTKFAQDARFKLFNFALGDTKSVERFTISSHTGASSLLQMSPLQAKHFPGSLDTHQIDVKVELLDDIFAQERLEGPYLLKLDVQGFEYQVMQGGDTVLRHASIVILEASYDAFYEGQKLFDDVYEQLRSRGFRLRDTFNMGYDPATGEALQGDFIFIK